LNWDIVSEPNSTKNIDLCQPSLKVEIDLYDKPKEKTFKIPIVSPQ
jgi:hypothetical protein